MEYVFQGFAPSNSLRVLAAELFGVAEETCPYDCVPIVFLDRIGSRYRCLVEIYSRIVPFVVEAEDADPELALRQAAETLFHKLALWRTHRFAYGRPRRPERAYRANVTPWAPLRRA